MKTAVNGHPIAGAIAAALMTLRPELLSAVTDEDLLNPEYVDGLRECLRELVALKLEVWEMKQALQGLRMTLQPTHQWLEWVRQKTDKAYEDIDNILFPPAKEEA